MGILDRGTGIVPVPTAVSNSFRPLTAKVLIAMPWYKSVSPMTALCVAQLADKRRVGLMQNSGDAFVAHTRNALVREFLKSTYEWMLSIDDDMVVPCGVPNWFRAYTGWHKLPDPFASFNAIDRLLSHNKTVVGGLYFGRAPGGPPVYAEGMSIKSEAEYARKAPYDLIKPTNWVGAGCLLTHRTVFEDIVKKYPRLDQHWYTSSEHTLVESVERTVRMLEDGPMTGEKALRAYEMLSAAEKQMRAISNLGVGEDVILCRRARESGHPVYIDMGLVCGHVGHKVYPENFCI
jgi:hypothetical protein